MDSSSFEGVYYTEMTQELDEARTEFKYKVVWESITQLHKCHYDAYLHDKVKFNTAKFSKQIFLAQNSYLWSMVP